MTFITQLWLGTLHAFQFSMENRMSPSRVVSRESAGFLAIITLSWLDEWLGLPSLILQDHPYISDFHESTIEMLLVLGVWFLVSRSTGRLLNRVRYLEGFMRVCAWCRRIHHRGRWIPMEDFFEQSFDTPTTHGICPTCLKKEVPGGKRESQPAKPVPSPGGRGQPLLFPPSPATTPSRCGSTRHAIHGVLD